ncbi:MAG: Gfo/Idh/MocA family oxidoreductase [Planctomycetes bacterium]|nr:Gfo/Idh/MocA family oxidoreductase [Planctomycetota bacterium]
MSRLRAGVFGCGSDAVWSAARIRAQAATELAGCELAAAADTDPAALRAFGATTGVDLLVDSFEALLRTGIDFVILAGPPDERAEQVAAAVDQGVHCLTHAPLAPDAAAADAMVAAAEAAGLKLGVIARGQDDPVFEQIRQMIAADWLGGVVHVQALAGRDDLLRVPPELEDPRIRRLASGTPLLHLGAHHVHLATWLTGRQAVSATAATGSGFLPLPADGIVATVVRRGGVLCTHTASHLLVADQVAIHGTDGFVRVAGDRLLMRGRDEFRGEAFDYLVPGSEQGLNRADFAAAAERAAPALELHTRFGRWIDDRDDFPCPGEQAAADMRLLDAIERAATSERTEAV